MYLEIYYFTIVTLLSLQSRTLTVGVVMALLSLARALVHMHRFPAPFPAICAVIGCFEQHFLLN